MIIKSVRETQDIHLSRFLKRVPGVNYLYFTTIFGILEGKKKLNGFLFYYFIFLHVHFKKHIHN